MTIYTKPLVSGIARKAIFCGAFAAMMVMGGIAANDASANEYRAHPVVVKEVIAAEVITYRPGMPAQPAYGPGPKRIDYGATCYSSGFHTPDPAMGTMGMGMPSSAGFAVALPMQTGVGRTSIPIDFDSDGPNHLRQQSRSERLPAPIRPLHTNY